MLERFPRAQAWIADALHRAAQWSDRVGTVGPNSTAGKRFGFMGPSSAIAFPPGATFGERWIRIGAGTLIGPHVSLSAGIAPGEPLQPTDGWVVRIGERCNIGRGGSIVARHRVDIGDDVTMGPNVYITDHNHGYDDPSAPIGPQWVSTAPVRVGSGSWLAAGVVVLPGADIGSNVVVAAGSVVRGVVPARCVVAGVPARVVRRHDGTAWIPPIPPSPVDGRPPADWPAPTPR